MPERGLAAARCRPPPRTRARTPRCARHETRMAVNAAPAATVRDSRRTYRGFSAIFLPGRLTAYPATLGRPRAPGCSRVYVLPAAATAAAAQTQGSLCPSLSLAAAARHPDPPTKVGLATPSGYPKERARTAGCARTVAPPGRVYLVQNGSPRAPSQPRQQGNAP